MAFMLPVAIGGGAISGFFMGYFYNQPSEQFVDGVVVSSCVTAKELKKLKEKSPHKDIHEELINFNKEQLIKINEPTKYVSADEEFLNKIRDKMNSRRKIIQTI